MALAFSISELGADGLGVDADRPLLSAMEHAALPFAAQTLLLAPLLLFVPARRVEVRKRQYLMRAVVAVNQAKATRYGAVASFGALGLLHTFIVLFLFNVMRAELGQEVEVALLVVMAYIVFQANACLMYGAGIMRREDSKLTKHLAAVRAAWVFGGRNLLARNFYAPLYMVMLAVAVASSLAITTFFLRLDVLFHFAELQLAAMLIHAFWALASVVLCVTAVRCRLGPASATPITDPAPSHSHPGRLWSERHFRPVSAQEDCAGRGHYSTGQGRSCWGKDGNSH